MRRLIIILLAGVLFNGCGPRTTGPLVTTSTLSQRLADIHAFLETETCDPQTQCMYMAYGKKSCGGPSGYLLFSENIDVVKLKKMVDAYTIAEDVYNKENNIISDCSLPNPPQKMKCEGGKCIKVK